MTNDLGWKAVAFIERAVAATAVTWRHQSRPATS
jgi:hypothetical protein